LTIKGIYGKSGEFSGIDWSGSGFLVNA
jgi:hypothetical protein